MPVQTRSTTSHSRAASSTTVSRKRRRRDVIVEVVIEQAAPKSRGRKSVKDAAESQQILTTLVSELPSELLVDIFSHLSWEERVNCRLACRHWNSVLLSTPALWTDPKLIKDCLTDIVKRLDGIMSKYFRALSLELNPVPTTATRARARNMAARRDATLLIESFPSASLRELNCRRSNEYGMGTRGESSVDKRALWKCVTSCSQLQILRWRSKMSQYGCSPPGSTMECIDFSIEGTPLAECRLDELTFDCPYEPKIDDAFLQLISQVKRLDIDIFFEASQTPSDLVRILDAVKDTIEELTFTNFVDGYPGEETLDAMEANMEAKSIEMPNLRKFNAAYRLLGSEYSRFQLPNPCLFIAPRITSLSFARQYSIDWDLLESCRDNLQSFTVGTGGNQLTYQLQRELFNMPALVDLALDLTNDGSSYYKCDDSYFFSSFWKAIDQGYTGRHDISIEDVLPKLKSLTIIDDETATFERIMGFLELRAELGLTPIESLTLTYHFNYPFDDGEEDELKSQVAKVEIEEHDDTLLPPFCDMRCDRWTDYHDLSI